MHQFLIDSSVLVVFMLATCLACLYMVFFFGRRLQTSAYLRDSLVEGEKQQELRILLRELREKAQEGPLNPEAPPPQGYGSTGHLWDARIKTGASIQPSKPLNESAEEKEARLTKEKEEKQRLDAFEQWSKEERVRFEKLKIKAEDLALKRARKKIPSSIDISLLGGGWAFLLEFSTVIVIIFTLLILGVLKILEGKEISTILAAIAGYVLGKASASARQQYERPSSQETDDALDREH